MRGTLACLARRDTIFRLAKGFRGRAKNVFKIAIRRVEKGLQYAYKSRRLKKRNARREWITQIGAGSREHGLVYSQLIRGMYLTDIGINRKMMALLARTEPYSFRAIVEEAKTALRKTPQGEASISEPSIVPDARRSSTVDGPQLPPYDGPPLPPYPSRIKHFS
jgi:large subunit ribosomal protein L20